MTEIWAQAALWLGLALVAALVSIWLRIATALSEIVVGTVAQLFIGAVLGSAVLAGDAIWNALRSAALWLEEKSREAHYRRIESYLAESTDHADLERRLRDLERGNRLNWTDCGSR